LTDRLDLARARLDALVEPEPIFMQAHGQVVAPMANLVLPVSQNLQKRIAQRPRPSPDGDALFDEKGANPVDGRGATDDRTGTNSAAGPYYG